MNYRANIKVSLHLIRVRVTNANIIDLDIKTEKMITGKTPTEEEVQKLYDIKADKAEFDSLKADFLRLEGIVDQLDGDYSGDDSYDEYDDEDSQVEDVISLGEGGSGGKEEGDDEEFFEGDDEETKKLADKAKELTQKTLKQGSVLDSVKKISEEKAKDDEETKGPERKCTEDEHIKNKELNKDIQEAEK